MCHSSGVTTTQELRLLPAWIGALTSATAVFCGHYMDVDSTAFDDLAGDAAGHRGARTRKIDNEARKYSIAWATRNKPPLCGDHPLHIEAEDGGEPWQGLGDPANAPVIVRLDPFDGTTIGAATGTNWSVVGLVFVYNTRRGRYILAAGAIACHDGRLYTYHGRDHHDLETGVSLDEGDLSVSRFTMIPNDGHHSAAHMYTIMDENRQSHRVEEQFADFVSAGAAREITTTGPGDPAMVAISASAGTTRLPQMMQKYPQAFTETSFRTLLAGTPSITGAVVGRLGAIIDPSRSDIHDAAHTIFLAAACGWRAWDLATGERLNVVEIAEQHAEPNRSADRVKPYPPHALARIRPSWLTFGDRSAVVA